MRMQLLIAMVTVSALSAQAKLGETKAQLDKRYPRMLAGSGTSTNQLAGESLEIYNYKDLHFLVTYSNGVSIVEQVRTVGKRKIPPQERLELMKLMGGEGDWAKTAASEAWMAGALVNTKTGAMAHYTEVPSGVSKLIVASPAFVAKSTAVLQEMEKSRKNRH